MGRPPLELIEELKVEAQNFRREAEATGSQSLVALALGFRESGTVFIVGEGDQQAQIAKLDEAIGQGGEPIGMIALIYRNGEGRFYSRLLEEHEGEAWLDSYLKRLITACGDLIGGASLSPGEWIN